LIPLQRIAAAIADDEIRNRQRRLTDVGFSGVKQTFDPKL
jgi:hypothetical protein